MKLSWLAEPGKNGVSNYHDYPLEEDPLELYDRDDDIKPSKKNDLRLDS